MRGSAARVCFASLVRGCALGVRSRRGRRSRVLWCASGAIAAFAIASLLSGSTLAQTPPQTPPTVAPTPPPVGSPDPSLVAPHLLSEARIDYPDGATGSAEVVLELVVEADGTIGDVRTIEGDEPFASAAQSGVRAYRFAPATRAGKAVRARIRIATTFTPPTAPAAPEPSPPSTPSAPAKAAPSKPPANDYEEVTVLGHREPVSPTMHRMGRAEVRVVPGAFGDPFRAIDVLPGLVPIVSGLPYFYIRGAPPSAVGYYVDEVRVPYLFHFAFGPGVIQPALIDEVSLHPAAFPARYGRYAGGIVAGSTREPAKELTGEAQIRIFDAGAYVEAPFAGGRGSAGVGGRYAYAAGILSLVAPEITIDYRDYNARVSYDLSDRWRATLFTFGSFDYASSIEDGVEDVAFASEFHRVDARFDHRAADGATTRVAATFGLDRTRLGGERFAQNFLVGTRARHVRRLTSKLEFEAGVDATFDIVSGDMPSPYAVGREEYDQAAVFFAPRTDTATGIWVGGNYHPRPGWDVTAAVRGDIYTSKGKVGVGPSPRLSMRVPLTSRIAFLGALGIAPQPPAFAIPIPAVGYSGLPGGLAFAYQKSAGFETKLPARFTLKTVGFHHTYFNLRDFAQDREGLDFDDPQLTTGSPSQAFGLEVHLARKLSERFAAFGSLTLMRAQFGSTRLTPSTVSQFDRTWVAQIGGVVDLGRNWRFSSRFLTYRGRPSTPDADNPFAPRSERLPDFFRIDARLEKRWVWNDRRYIALVFEGLNVTGAKEVLSRSCVAGISGGASQCKDEDFGPVVIPSIGVEGGL